MSSVRMCDNCRSIFSENDPGWQRGTVRNLATVNGQSVVQTQSEDRCPSCAVGAVAQGNAVRIYEPERPRTLRGMDPRIQSAIGKLAAMTEPGAMVSGADVVKTLGELAGGMGTDLSEPAADATSVLPEGVDPVQPRSLPGTVGATTPALEDGRR